MRRFYVVSAGAGVSVLLLAFNYVMQQIQSTSIKPDPSPLQACRQYHGNPDETGHDMRLRHVKSGQCGGA
jgi:hypothetical protein